MLHATCEAFFVLTCFASSVLMNGITPMPFSINELSVPHKRSSKLSGTPNVVRSRRSDGFIEMLV
jgi:hypothetical protein